MRKRRTFLIRTDSGQDEYRKVIEQTTMHTKQVREYADGNKPYYFTAAGDEVEAVDAGVYQLPDGQLGRESASLAAN